MTFKVHSSIFFSKCTQVEDSLRNVYSYLQRLAVGLEQVVLDQTIYDGRFLEDFNEAEFKLKAVSEGAERLFFFSSFSDSIP